MLREPSYVENESPAEAPPSLNLYALRLLIDYSKRYPLMIFGSLLSLILAAGTVVGLGIGIRYLIDQGFTEQTLNYAVFVLFGIVLLMATASFCRLYFVSQLSERVITDLRKTIFGHLLHLDVGYYDKTPLGEVQSRLTTDTLLLQVVLGTSIPIALRNIMIITGGLTMLVMTSPFLSLIIGIWIPLVVLPVAFFGRRVKELSRIAQDKTGLISGRLDETFSFIRTVVAYNREKYVTDEFNTSVNSAYDASMARVKMRSVMTGVVLLCVFGGVSFVLWMGGKGVLDGTLTAGELSAFIFYAITVAGSTGSLSEIFGDLRRASGAAERILDCLHIKPTIKAGREIMPLEGAIAFNDVSFSYHKDVPVLKNISFHVHPGETVALVGPSGAGKSTLFNLLLRFYDPTSGDILLDGAPLKSLAFDSFRNEMALVPQEPALFSESVYDNIRFGNLGATREEIEHAARLSHAEEFIDRFPEGYNTYVGEKGIQLSGGQRQRIALARAILRNPKILLLDEATSALDNESEKKVQLALESIMRDRTTLVIAHRLSTVQHASRILVFDQGELVDEGTHRSLMKKPGLYKRLVEARLH